MLGMLRRPHPILTALRRIADDVGHGLRHLHELREIIVANFDALNAQIAGLGTALDEAIARIDADFQALRDQLASDAGDQAAVDAATARLAESVDRLRAIDPDPANPTPAPEV